MKRQRFLPLSALALTVLVGCSNASSSKAQRPFALGPAIRGQCEGEGAPAAFCPPLNEVIAQMLAEQRDENWADDMEKRIDQAMQVNGKYWAEIRSLECRRTLCALEYAARIDSACGVNARAFDALLRSLEPVSGGMGFELPKVDSEARVIGVMVWKRAPAAS